MAVHRGPGVAPWQSRGVVMMGDGYEGGSPWTMWVFGGWSPASLIAGEEAP